jgi:hypothetical protein
MTYREMILDVVHNVDPGGWWCVGEIVAAQFEDDLINDTERNRNIFRNGIHAAFMKLKSEGSVEAKKGESEFIKWTKKRVWFFRLLPLPDEEV